MCPHPAGQQSRYLSVSLSGPCCKPGALTCLSERTYPWQLASKLADGFVSRKLVVVPPQVAPARAATLAQPKASKFPAFVSEHQQVVLVTGSADWPVSCMARLKADLPLPPSACCALRVLPAGAQLLRVTLATVNRGELRGELSSGEEAGQTAEWVSAWGIPRTLEEFVKAAIKAGHPCQMEAALPQALQQAIDRNAATSAEQLARDRALFFQKWLARAKELEPEEKKFKASLPEHVAAILAPKRLLLWKELLAHYQYPDQQVFQEVTEGIRLTGRTPATGIFPPTFKPALRQEADLHDWAPGARARVFDRIRPQGAADAVVHEKTLEEREKGWAKGPVSRDALQGSSLVSRRFGLRQGEKTRLVDDLRFSGVNDLVTVQESPKPHGPDVVAASMLAFMKAAPGVPLEGRPYDLRSAYRQLPIHPDTLQHAFVAHWNPGPATVEVDQLLALPFGASRSVFGFIRAATSIWWLGCVALGLCWSVFFDDFITISKAEDVKHTEAAVCTFFCILGWLFAPGCNINASWMSEMMQPGDFLAHEPTGRLMRVVAAGPCSVLASQAEVRGMQDGSSMFLLKADMHAITWEHIVDFTECLVVPTMPALLQEAKGPLGWVQSGDAQTLACSLCLRGLKLTKLQLQELSCKFGGQAPPSSANKRQLQEMLITIALVSLEQQKQAMDQLATQSQHMDNEEIDSEFSEILSELDKKKQQAQRWRKIAHSC